MSARTPVFAWTPFVPEVRETIETSPDAFPDALLSAYNILLNKIVIIDCDSMLDADDDGPLSITDPIWLLSYLFVAGGALPEPFAECGMDDDADLGCRESNCE